jgi:thiol-disulfide isomerase/thioredoxin
VKNWMWFGVVGLVVVAVALVLAGGGESDGGTENRTAFGTVSVVGETLPPYASGADGAVGMPAPSIQGDDFTFTPGQRPTVLVFLAHWCPHCRNEVPVLQAIVDEGLVPEGLSVVGVATSTNSTQVNYPPGAWLEREGWSSPLIFDDQRNSAAEAFGVTSFPFWTVVGSDGVVSGRLAGEIGREGILQLLDIAASR